MGHEVTLIEQRRDRFERLEQEFEHQVQPGRRHRALRPRAGRDHEAARHPRRRHRRRRGQHHHLPARPREVRRAEGRRPRQRPAEPGALRPARHRPTVCATSSLLALVVHEVPEHGLVHLLELRKENLEIVEVQIDARSPCLGKALSRVKLPEGAQLIASCVTARLTSATGTSSSRAATRCWACSSPAGRKSYATRCSDASARAAAGCRCRRSPGRARSASS